MSPGLRQNLVPEHLASTLYEDSETHVSSDVPSLLTLQKMSILLGHLLGQYVYRYSFRSPGVSI